MISEVQILKEEVNATSIVEPYFWFAHNVQLELFWNSNFQILDQDSFLMSKETIYGMMNIINKINNEHLNTKNIVTETYASTYE